MEVKSQTKLEDLEIEARRVLMRVDFDLPIEDGKIQDYTKVNNIFPTINYLTQNGARVVLMSHLGNPQGKTLPSFSLEPIAEYLAQQTRFDEVFLTDSCVGDGARCVIQSLREGQICVLENLGFHAGEFSNDEKLARQLASFCDIYVNEAFSLNEHKFASISKITKHARLKTTGLVFNKELEGIATLLKKSSGPFVFIMGGDSIMDNLEIFECFIPKIDILVVCGNTANTFIAATGGQVGNTIIEKNKLPLARDIMERAARRGIKLVLPSDFVTNLGIAEAGKIAEDITIEDIGPESIKNIKQIIGKAETTMWKGKVGIKNELICEGSLGITKAMVGSASYTAVIGKTAPKIVKTAGLEKGLDFISTGENATLAMLRGKTLPALIALGS